MQSTSLCLHKGKGKKENDRGKLFRKSFIFNNILVVNINIYATNFPLVISSQEKEYR